MRIGFHTNYLGFRGTDKAIVDYAIGVQQELGHEAVLLFPHGQLQEGALKERAAHFAEIRPYSDLKAVTKDLDACYVIKYGNNDGLELACPQLVHAVFEANHPHGHKYAAISDWLGGRDGCEHVVPHIVRLDGFDYSSYLTDVHTVKIGCIGGADSFDLPWAQRALFMALNDREDLCFRSMGLAAFIDHPRATFYPAGTDVYRLITESDAMLHARSRGETFGLAVAEFGLCGCHIMTYADCGERAHIDHLDGDPGLFMYANEEQLYNHLMSLDKNNIPFTTASRWHRFSQKNVMQVFNDVFLKDLSTK